MGKPIFSPFPDGISIKKPSSYWGSMETLLDRLDEAQDIWFQGLPPKIDSWRNIVIYLGFHGNIMVI